MSAALRNNRFAQTTIALLLITTCLTGYTAIMAKWGSSEPPITAPTDQQADLIVVHKAARTLILMRHGIPIAHYTIVMGKNADSGPKRQEGDRKTPEGRYTIDSRNTHSRFYLSLHISYPNQDDIRQAKEGSYPPGENIMIHGIPNGWGGFGPLFQHFNWTDGCIAVTNDDMHQIWRQVPTGTPIEIVP